MNIRFANIRILDTVLARINGSVDQLLDHIFKLRSRDLEIHVLGSRGICRNKGQGDIGLGQTIQFSLGLFRRFSQPLHGQIVTGQINARILFEFTEQMSQEFFIEIFSTQHGISVGRLDFKHTSLDFQNRHIKGPTSQIKDDNRLSIGLVHTVRQRGGGRFIDNSQDIESGNFAGIFGGLTLRVIKVGGDRDDGFGDGPSQKAFGRFLHFPQDHASDLRRTVFGATGFDPCIIVVIALDNFIRNMSLNILHFLILITSSDQALDGIEGILGICDGLAFGGHSYQTFSVCRKGNDRRSRTSTFRVFNHTGISAFHDGNT
mmetsp:Transcript_64177/g.179492  ORF Transcript_64177/g.179492 Transcript_64177/m.179492 type:complete len:318 (+) Transcript_64177:985-1938(+)